MIIDGQGSPVSEFTEKWSGADRRARKLARSILVLSG